MGKRYKPFDWRAALDQAIRTLRENAGRGEWHDGYAAGASAVHVEMMRLKREHANAARLVPLATAKGEK